MQQIPELWAGAECTVVRIRDDYRDQCEETGHALRAGDVDLFEEVGAAAVRFPILWERVAPEQPDRCDFSWTDARLEQMRARGLKVIAGLLHHGSGPKYTELLDPDFPAKLADYAARVAERYPWIESWTPVNEPLTTARFSGLYGHWYPHRTDDASYLRALVNQCRGTAAAMRAIRAVVPGAQLVQTEDLGKTFATAPLAYQADYENERRWLSLDLLCGRVTPDHPWHATLLRWGIGADELEELADGSGRPDLIGVNHYLTSERFLDHRTHLYPDQPVGGNGRDTYVDGEAVRVSGLEPDLGMAARLRECWDRYRLPLAVTEVHHGCTRAEQLRWFVQVWEECAALARTGVDLRAVTLWSMFGNVDWRSLLTERHGFYDTGAYDTRSGTPRPTAIARAARALARGERFDHPALDQPGWWRRPGRLYPWNEKDRTVAHDGRKLLITGASGTLGRALARTCDEGGLAYVLTSRDELDLCADGAAEAAIARHRPWAVINAAGFVRVADAERERDACFAWNAAGAERLARACADAGIAYATFSSDLVFDGQLGRSYLEDDPVSPASVYGASKAEAERLVVAAHPDALIVRTAAFFGPWDCHNFAWAALTALSEGRHFAASRTATVSPTYVPDLCHAVLDLLVDGESGLWHLANAGRMSWYEFAERLALEAGYDPALIVPEDGPAADTSLERRHGAMLRPVEQAIGDYVAAVRERLAPPALGVAAE